VDMDGDFWLAVHNEMEAEQSKLQAKAFA